MKLGKNFKGADKEQTLLLSRASTLHNLLFYAYSLCLIDQTQTVSMAHFPIHICRSVFVLCRVTVEKSEQKDRTYRLLHVKSLISFLFTSF